MSLVKTDLRTRYRRSVLGMGWSLLHPIAMTVIICLMFHRIFKVDVRDFAPFLLAGLAGWNFIVGVTLQGCQCFFQGESYIRQYPAPMAIYPLRTALGAAIHFLLALTVVLILTGYLRGLPNSVTLLSLVPNVVLLFMFGWSLAILAGFANVFFQDTQHLCEVGFQILFYATPIMYPARMLQDNQLAWLVNYNPLVAIIELIREPILEGRTPSLSTYSAAITTVSVVAGAAALTLARLQRRIIFHL
jgi:ABC-type polysaccharide/polyol phosphate export permease